jgi:Arc/MetJ-type ribon-helix-helix transcriptional regulator
MVIGMATRKITVTLTDKQIDEIRKRVAARQSSSVSGYVQKAVERSLQSAAEFHAMIDEALEQSGGPLTAKERTWARKVLSPKGRGTKLLRAKTGVSDIVDAHVVVCAQETDFAVITSDASDLRRLDPSLSIVAV